MRERRLSEALMNTEVFEKYTLEIISSLFNVEVVPCGEIIEGRQDFDIPFSWEIDIKNNRTPKQLSENMNDLFSYILNTLIKYLNVIEGECIYIRNITFCEDVFLYKYKRFGYYGWIDMCLTKRELNFMKETLEQT